MLPSFLTVITSAYSGAYVNRQNIIESICGKELVTLSEALLRAGSNVFDKGFTYSRDYEVSMNSFETVFPYMKDFKSFKTTFSTLMIIFIVLLAILSFFCFFKYFCSGRQRIVIQPIQDQENREASQNLINDSKNELKTVPEN